MLPNNPETQRYDTFSKIRDKPLTILVAIILLGGFADYLQLEDWCHYSRPTLRKHMKVLLRYGLVKPVNQSRFMITDGARQLLLFEDENIFQLDSSSINVKGIDSLKELKPLIPTTTTTCKSFTASQEIKEYLKSKGVWVTEIDKIAELLDNDLVLAKAHFEKTDTALAIHRLRTEKPSNKDIAENVKQTNYSTAVICGICGESTCDCSELKY